MGETIVEKRTGGCLSSWFGRIVIGAIAIGIIGVIIAVVAYMDVKSDRGKPLDIEPYRGLREVSVTKLSESQQQIHYQQLYENFTLEDVREIEAHYSRQADKACSRLSDQTANEGSQIELAATHTIICEVDRSNDTFGFIQGARIRVVFSHNADTGELTGQVDVTVTQWWTE
jgi:hypothetical protein